MVVLTYMSKDFDELEQESYNIRTEGGRALLNVSPPAESVALTLRLRQSRPMPP